MALPIQDVHACLANERLHLVLMPTEACNFRCTYCYESFEHGTMARNVVLGIERLLRRRAPTLDWLKISWFGGEPLLAASVIRTIMGHTQSLRLEHPRLQLYSDMTTNGYLLSPSLFEELVELGVRHFQVSFDGPQPIHDRKRILAGGRGTFDRIWKNLQSASALSNDFQITVRLHVDPENHVYLPTFIEKFRDAFAGDRRFRLFFRKLEQLGGPNDDSFEVFDEASGAPIIESLTEHARALGLRSIVAEDLNPICYASRANSFIVRSDGRLNKCTVALEHPNNQVGRIREDGRIELDGNRLSPWMRGLWSEQTEDLECPMRGYADAMAVPDGHVKVNLQQSSHQPSK